MTKKWLRDHTDGSRTGLTDPRLTAENALRFESIVHDRLPKLMQGPFTQMCRDVEAGMNKLNGLHDEAAGEKQSVAQTMLADVIKRSNVFILPEKVTQDVIDAIGIRLGQRNINFSQGFSII